MTRSLAAALALTTVLTAASLAAADPTIAVSPTTVTPGRAVLVTVTGATAAPQGKAGGAPLHFFPAKGGYQAVFAIPLDVNEDHVLVELAAGARPLSIPVTAKSFPESKVVVEEEMANPPKADRDRIDADNHAMIAVFGPATEAPLFTAAFARPAGAVTSTYGEWRTFNDGHRSQHLGLDLGEREGQKVLVANRGTVVLVRDTFLAGNVVVVDHGGGISSLYFHLAKATVAEGDKVDRGGVLGLVGHTGRTTGPHLHVSIAVNGTLVDPAGFFALPIAPTDSAKH